MKNIDLQYLLKEFDDDTEVMLVIPHEHCPKLPPEVKLIISPSVDADPKLDRELHIFKLQQNTIE
jgi:hypothetical protein